MAADGRDAAAPPAPTAAAAEGETTEYADSSEDFLFDEEVVTPRGWQEEGAGGEGARWSEMLYNSGSGTDDAAGEDESEGGADAVPLVGGQESDEAPPASPRASPGRQPTREATGAAEEQPPRTPAGKPRPLADVRQAERNSPDSPLHAPSDDDASADDDAVLAASMPGEDAAPGGEPVAVGRAPAPSQRVPADARPAQLGLRLQDDATFQAAVPAKMRARRAPMRLGSRQSSTLSDASSTAKRRVAYKERFVLQRGGLCACPDRTVEATIVDGKVVLTSGGGDEDDDVEAVVGCCPYCLWCWQCARGAESPPRAQYAHPDDLAAAAAEPPLDAAPPAGEARPQAEAGTEDARQAKRRLQQARHARAASDEAERGKSPRAAMMAALAGRVMHPIEFDLRENVVSVEYAVQRHSGSLELEYAYVALTVIVPAAKVLTNPMTPMVETLRLEGGTDTCRRWAERARAELRADELRPRRLAVLVGRRSGDGSGPRAWAQAEEVLCAAECGPIEVPIQGSVRETAKQIAAEAAEADLTGLAGWDGLVVVGGDGILSEAFAGLMEGYAEAIEASKKHAADQKAVDDSAPPPLPPLRLGVIPAGSTDAVACGVLGTREPRVAAACVALGRFRMLDAVRLASADGAVTRSLSFAGLGLFADTVESSEGLRWLGKARLNLAGAMCFFRGRSYAARVRYRSASMGGNCEQWRTAEGSFHLLGAAMETKNDKSPAGLTPAMRRPGTTNLVMVRKTSRFSFLRFLSQLSAGRGEHARHPSFDCLPDVTEFVVENAEAPSKAPTWQSDGEFVVGSTTRISGKVEREAAPLFAFLPQELIPEEEAERLRAFGPLNLSDRRARKWINTELVSVEHAAV